MKKGTIILAGGGGIKDSFELDRIYFSLLSKSAKILYIPIALQTGIFSAESCHNWFTKLLTTHDTGGDIDFTMHLAQDPVPNLTDYESIYMGGGNTYRLLTYLISSGMDKRIIDFTARGGIVYGGSAGAMVLGKDIRTAEEENDSNYPHFLGCNLLGGKSVVCHYSDALKQKISSIQKKITTPILALSEQSGLVLDTAHNVVATIGNVVLFD